MKLPTFLLAAAFLLSSLLMQSQTKYEYMIIEYDTFIYEISVSIDGDEFKSEKVSVKNPGRSTHNANPFLLKVKTYQERGWEVMSFNTLVSGAKVHYAYLRKPKTK